MNKVILIGRLTKDPEVRYTQGQETMAVARYTLAVDRNRKQDNGQNADFVNCISFKKMQSLLRNFCTKEQRLLLLDASRQVATQIRMDRRCTQQM